MKEEQKQKKIFARFLLGRKPLCWLLCACCIALIISSCRHEKDDNEPPATLRKTIILWMPWTASMTSTSGSLYTFFQKNIEDCEKAIVEDGGLNDCRLMVFIQKNATQAALVNITYDRGTCFRDTLSTYTNVDVTSPDKMAQVLEQIKAVAPAETYGLVIGSHGDGWLPKDITIRKTRAYGGSVPRFRTDISDLAEALSLASLHPQFILFDDCYMANVETAFALRQHTDWLLASTSEVMSAGVPYAEVWNELTAEEPNYEKICQAFYTYYIYSETPYGTLSAIRCEKMDEVAALMKEINKRYTFHSSHINQIQKLDGYEETVFFDFGSYLKDLCLQDDPLFAQMQVAMQELVPWHVHTAQIYSIYQFAYVDVTEFSGITISDPTENSLVEGRLSETAWWEATQM